MRNVGENEKKKRGGCYYHTTCYCYDDEHDEGLDSFPASQSPEKLMECRQILPRSVSDISDIFSTTAVNVQEKKKVGEDKVFRNGCNS